MRENNDNIGKYNSCSIGSKREKEDAGTCKSSLKKDMSDRD